MKSKVHILYYDSSAAKYNGSRFCFELFAVKGGVYEKIGESIYEKQQDENHDTAAAGEERSSQTAMMSVLVFG